MTKCVRSHLMHQIPEFVSPLAGVAGALLCFCPECYALDGFVTIFVDNITEEELVRDDDFLLKRNALFKNQDSEIIQVFQEQNKKDYERFDWSAEFCASFRRDESCGLIAPIMYQAYRLGWVTAINCIKELSRNVLIETKMLDIFWTYLEEKFQVTYRRYRRYLIARWDNFVDAKLIYNVKTADGECAICYETYSECLTLVCKHGFHLKCFRKWRNVS